MRVLASYALVMYGVFTVASVGGAVRGGRIAPAGGLAVALTGITMIFAALGVLMSLKSALVVAIVSVAGISLLAAYNAFVLHGRPGLRGEAGRSVMAVVLIALFVFGN